MRSLKGDLANVELDPADRALLEYARTLTQDPASITAEHVEALRDAGFDDRAITDAAHNIAFFGYINRMALGLGVELESFMVRGGETIAPGEELPSE